MLADIKIMGVQVKYELPANLQELLAMPGMTEEKLFKGYLNQTLFHGSYGAIRAKASEVFDGTCKDEGASTLADFNISKRESTVNKKIVVRVDKEVDGKPTKVWAFESNGKELTEAQIDLIDTETDAKYFLRICAERERPIESFVDALQFAANNVKYDVTRKERSSAEKKANRAHLKIASDIADNGALERVAAQLSVDLGVEIDVSGDRDDAINALALAIGANERREAEIRKNRYMAMGS